MRTRNREFTRAGMMLSLSSTLNSHYGLILVIYESTQAYISDFCVHVGAHSAAALVEQAASPPDIMQFVFVLELPPPVSCQAEVLFDSRNTIIERENWRIV